MTIDLEAGPERAVPATKTFTGQLVALAIVAEALGRVPWQADDWERLPVVVGRVLDDPGPPRLAAEEMGEAAGLITTGRGILYPIALEAALKLKETTGTLAEGYSAADLRHGPIAVIEEGFPVFVFSAPGPAAQDMDVLVHTLMDRRARVFRVREGPQAELPVPPGAPEALVPVPMIVRAQQVAHSLALRRGLDPDNPPGLSKVTITT